MLFQNGKQVVQVKDVFQHTHTGLAVYIYPMDIWLHNHFPCDTVTVSQIIVYHAESRSVHNFIHNFTIYLCNQHHLTRCSVQSTRFTTRQYCMYVYFHAQSILHIYTDSLLHSAVQTSPLYMTEHHINRSMRLLSLPTAGLSINQCVNPPKDAQSCPKCRSAAILSA